MNNAVLNRAVLGCAYVGTADVGGVGVMGALDEGEVQPYIKGHVTDGSSTFTFNVNKNQSVTVPVDGNGNWKWVVDRTITSFEKLVQNKTNIDKLYINLQSVSNLTSCYYMCENASNLKEIAIVGDWASVTNAERMFYNTKLTTLTIKGQFAPIQMANFAFVGTNNADLLFPKEMFRNATTLNRAFMGANVKLLDLSLADNCSDFSYIGQNNNNLVTLKLPNIKVNATFICGNSTNLENIEVLSTKSNLDFQKCGKLTEQSIVNIFNAVAADGVVLTFHQNVWNMIMREIDVQGSPIQVAYQNMIDNYDVTIANASFDAEIEYLKGDGNAYIKTNDLFKINTIIKIIVTNSDVLHENRYHIVGTFKSGARYRISTMDFKITTYYWYGASSSADVGDLSTTKTTYVITYNSLKKYQNNSIVKDLSFKTEYVSNNVPISMFFCDESGDFYEHFLGEIYACQIYEGDTLVRDFIPVRKGTTGYMYDKVSGNLFGNSGTGDFILGNDK